MKAALAHGAAICEQVQEKVREKHGLSPEAFEEIKASLIDQAPVQHGRSYIFDSILIGEQKVRWSGVTYLRRVAELSHMLARRLSQFLRFVRCSIVQCWKQCGSAVPTSPRYRKRH